MSKHLFILGAFGGVDGLNLLHYRNARDKAIMETYRASGVGNILPDFFTQAINLPGNLIAGTSTISMNDTTNIINGMMVYSVDGKTLKRQRGTNGLGLTVTNVNRGQTPNVVTMSGPSYVTANDVQLEFKTSLQLYKANEVPSTNKDIAFNMGVPHIADTFNIKDNIGNLGETKCAMISAIGPLRSKVVKITAGATFFQINRYISPGVSRTLQTGEFPTRLTSHNDQQSVVMSNTPEGATKGWGGGIADTFLDEISGDLNRPLASISAGVGQVFAAGSVVAPYNISDNGLTRNFPDSANLGVPMTETNATALLSLKNIINQAALHVPTEYTNDFISASVPLTDSAQKFNALMSSVMEITTSPAQPTFSYPGSAGSRGATYMKTLQQILRLILANDPNRGGTFTRIGNTVTVETEVTNGTASRVQGQVGVTITTSGNHGLFTSNTGTANLSDSVLITGIDASPPANGYKITLVPGSENTRITCDSLIAATVTETVPVTVRLKHNLTADNKIFLDGMSGVADSVSPPNGYIVIPYTAGTAIENATRFSFVTTDSGAFPSTTLTGKFKLLNLSKQVHFTNTFGIGFDTHNTPNHSELAAMSFGLNYFNSIAERIIGADVVIGMITDFGRTQSSNATGGTDHAWGNNTFVMGKSVRGNRVYGTPINYDRTEYNPNYDEANFATDMLVPTTSIYQYAATFAKWLGSTDAEILALFPDLSRWPLEERTLGFLDPLV